MEYAKKSALGGYKTTQDDQDATHVVLTVQEYKQMKEDAAALRQELSNARVAHNFELQQVRHDAAAEIEKEKEAARQAIDQSCQYAQEQKQQCDYERGLNENLRRICRERANADRGLKPKTQHTGYVVLSSKERLYKYRVGTKQKTVILWETILEMPFTVDLTPEQVAHEMQELFRDDASGDWPIAKIGITANYGKPYECLITDHEWKDWPNYNVRCDTTLRANYKSGYWEMIFTHTQPLGIVPKDMRP